VTSYIVARIPFPEAARENSGIRETLSAAPS
jgi:hypothetical protein